MQDEGVMSIDSLQQYTRMMIPKGNEVGESFSETTEALTEETDLGWGAGMWGSLSHCFTNQRASMVETSWQQGGPSVPYKRSAQYCEQKQRQLQVLLNSNTSSTLKPQTLAADDLLSKTEAEVTRAKQLQKPSNPKQFHQPVQHSDQPIPLSDSVSIKTYSSPQQQVFSASITAAPQETSFDDADMLVVLPQPKLNLLLSDEDNGRTNITVPQPQVVRSKASSFTANTVKYNSEGPTDECDEKVVIVGDSGTLPITEVVVQPSGVRDVLEESKGYTNSREGITEEVPTETTLFVMKSPTIPSVNHKHDLPVELLHQEANKTADQVESLMVIKIPDSVPLVPSQLLKNSIPERLSSGGDGESHLRTPAEQLHQSIDQTVDKVTSPTVVEEVRQVSGDPLLGIGERQSSHPEGRITSTPEHMTAIEVVSETPPDHMSKSCVQSSPVAEELVHVPVSVEGNTPTAGLLASPHQSEVLPVTSEGTSEMTEIITKQILTDEHVKVGVSSTDLNISSPPPFATEQLLVDVNKDIELVGTSGEGRVLETSESDPAALLSNPLSLSHDHISETNSPVDTNKTVEANNDTKVISTTGVTDTNSPKEIQPPSASWLFDIGRVAPMPAVTKTVVSSRQHSIHSISSKVRQTNSSLSMNTNLSTSRGYIASEQSTGSKLQTVGDTPPPVETDSLEQGLIKTAVRTSSISETVHNNKTTSEVVMADVDSDPVECITPNLEKVTDIKKGLISTIMESHPPLTSTAVDVVEEEILEIESPPSIEKSDPTQHTTRLDIKVEEVPTAVVEPPPLLTSTTETTVEALPEVLNETQVADIEPPLSVEVESVPPITSTETIVEVETIPKVAMDIKVEEVLTAVVEPPPLITSTAEAIVEEVTSPEVLSDTKQVESPLSIEKGEDSPAAVESHPLIKSTADFIIEEGTIPEVPLSDIHTADVDIDPPRHTTTLDIEVGELLPSVSSTAVEEEAIPIALSGTQVAVVEPLLSIEKGEDMTTVVESLPPITSTAEETPQYGYTQNLPLPLSPPDGESRVLSDSKLSIPVGSQTITDLDTEIQHRFRIKTMNESIHKQHVPVLAAGSLKESQSDYEVISESISNSDPETEVVDSDHERVIKEIRFDTDSSSSIRTTSLKNSKKPPSKKVSKRKQSIDSDSTSDHSVRGKAKPSVKKSSKKPSSKRTTSKRHSEISTDTSSDSTASIIKSKPSVKKSSKRSAAKKSVKRQVSSSDTSSDSTAPVKVKPSVKKTAKKTAAKKSVKRQVSSSDTSSDSTTPVKVKPSVKKISKKSAAKKSVKRQLSSSDTSSDSTSSVEAKPSARKGTENPSKRRQSSSSTDSDSSNANSKSPVKKGTKKPSSKKATKREGSSDSNKSPRSRAKSSFRKKPSRDTSVSSSPTEDNPKSSTKKGVKKPSKKGSTRRRRRSSSVTTSDSNSDQKIPKKPSKKKANRRSSTDSNQETSKQNGSRKSSSKAGVSSRKIDYISDCSEDTKSKLPAKQVDKKETKNARKPVSKKTSRSKTKPALSPTNNDTDPAFESKKSNRAAAKGNESKQSVSNEIVKTTRRSSVSSGSPPIKRRPNAVEEVIDESQSTPPLTENTVAIERGTPNALPTDLDTSLAYSLAFVHQQRQLGLRKRPSPITKAGDVKRPAITPVQKKSSGKKNTTGKTRTGDLPALPTDATFSPGKKNTPGKTRTGDALPTDATFSVQKHNQKRGSISEKSSMLLEEEFLQFCRTHDLEFGNESSSCLFLASLWDCKASASQFISTHARLEDAFREVSLKLGPVMVRDSDTRLPQYELFAVHYTSLARSRLSSGKYTDSVSILIEGCSLYFRCLTVASEWNWLGNTIASFAAEHKRIVNNHQVAWVLKLLETFVRIQKLKLAESEIRITVLQPATELYIPTTPSGNSGYDLLLVNFITAQAAGMEERLGIVRSPLSTIPIFQVGHREMISWARLSI